MTKVLAWVKLPAAKNLSTKHLGPGDHPSGSSQDVHGGGTGSAVEKDFDPKHDKGRMELARRFEVDPAVIPDRLVLWNEDFQQRDQNGEIGGFAAMDEWRALAKEINGLGSDPDAPRSSREFKRPDPASRWSRYNEDGVTLVYRGTKEEFAKDAKEKGLERSGIEWFGRPNSIYFTTDFERAERYARMLSYGNRYAVVEFEIPDSVDDSVIYDDEDERMLGTKNSFRIEMDIPAEWIRKVHLQDDLETRLVKAIRGKRPRRGFVVVLLEPAAARNTRPETKHDAWSTKHDAWSTKHLGPGDHPSGSPQAVHGGDGAGAPASGARRQKPGPLRPVEKADLVTILTAPDSTQVLDQQAAEMVKQRVFRGGQQVDEEVYTWTMPPIAAFEAVRDELETAISERSGLTQAEVRAALYIWAQTTNDTDGRALSMQQAAADEFGVPLSDFQKGRLNVLEATQNEVVADDLESIARFRSGEKDALPYYLSIQELEGVYGEDLIDLIKLRNEQYQTLVPTLTRQQERSFLRAMHDYTQEQFAAAGFQPDDTVRLYRGFNVFWRLDTATDPILNYPIGSEVDYGGNALESWSLYRGVGSSFGNVAVVADVPVTNIISTPISGFGVLGEAEFVVLGSVPGQVVTVFKGHNPDAEKAERKAQRAGRKAQRAKLVVDSDENADWLHRRPAYETERVRCRARLVQIGVDPLPALNSINLLTEGDRPAWIETIKHLGPGDHPSGSPQDVHGNGERVDYLAGLPKKIGDDEVKIRYEGSLGPEIFENYGLTEDTVRRMFYLEDLPGELYISLLTPNSDYIRYGEEEAGGEKENWAHLVIGVNWDDKQDKVGNASLVVYEGGEDIEINLIEFSSAAQGQSYGTTIFNRQLQVFREAGYKKAMLLADITIGRYAWAKAGADYARGTVLDRVNQNFSMWLWDHGIAPGKGWPGYFGEAPKLTASLAKLEAYDRLLGKPPSGNEDWSGVMAGWKPQDLANLKHPNGTQILGKKINNPDVPPDMRLDIGKAFLLDKGPYGHGEWQAQIDLQGE